MPAYPSEGLVVAGLLMAVGSMLDTLLVGHRPVIQSEMSSFFWFVEGIDQSVRISQSEEALSQIFAFVRVDRINKPSIRFRSHSHKPTLLSCGLTVLLSGYSPPLVTSTAMFHE